MRQRGLSQKSQHPVRRHVAPRAVWRSPGREPISVLRAQLGNAGLARVLRALHQSARQRQATVSAPGDPAERQADQVADQVLRMEEPANTNAPVVERAPAEDTGAALDGDAAVRAAQRGGEPLPERARAFFEPRFGHDFSEVRVHTDGDAAGAARAVEARAYTVGRDIVFGAGEYAPDTPEGRRLLAHELSHVVQQQGAAPQVQRRGKEEEQTEPLPSWVLSTPQGSLEGGRVPGYETDRATYTEADRFKMLEALNKRVQINGRRLAAFYHDLRMVWLDLVVELAIDDAGMSLGAQTILGIIGNLLTAPLGPTSGVIVGVIADGIINITDDVMTERDLEKRKRELKEMMVAPEVSDVGESDANGKLAKLLLDAVSYTAWLQTAPLGDLSKFRIPAEFPAVPEADIRFEVGKAVIKWRANQHAMYRAGFGYMGQGGGKMFTRPNDVAQWVRELIKVNPAGAPPNVVMVRMSVGRESTPMVSMNTHTALYKAVQGRRIGELTGVTVLATYDSFPYVASYTRPSSELGTWGDDPRAVAFGRNEDGGIVITGDFFSLKHMHDASSYETHPEDAAAENVDANDLTKSESTLRPHYAEYAAKTAKALLSKYIDTYVLPVRK